MTLRRRPDQSGAAEVAWLTPDNSRTARTLDLLLEAPVFAQTARVHPTRVAALLRHIAATSRSGIPLVAALNMLEETHRGTPAGVLCHELAVATSRGTGFAEALATHPETISDQTVAIVRAGERTGELGRGLESAATTLEEDTAAAAALNRAVGYPAVAAGSVGVLIAVLAVVITPLLSTIDTGRDLPAATRLLLDAARYLPLLLIPAALLAAASRAALRIPAAAAPLRARASRWALRLPGAALLVRQREHSRLAGTLAWLLAAGVSTADALFVTAAAATNREFRAAIARAAESAASGQLLSEAVAAEPLLAELAPVARTGEVAGTLPDLLRNHATLTRQDAQRTTHALAAVTEPVATTLAALVLLGWLLALFVPVLHASAAL